MLMLWWYACVFPVFQLLRISPSQDPDQWVPSEVAAARQCLQRPLMAGRTRGRGGTSAF